MKKTTLLLFFLCSFFSFSQNEKSYDLYVAFDTSIKFTESESYLTTINQAIPEFETFQQQYQFEVQKGITMSEENIDYLIQQGLKVSGNADAARQLRNLMILTFDQVDDPTLITLAEELNSLPGVTYTSLVSRIPEALPWDIPPATPNYEPLQNYIGPDPGVNMTYAWSLGLSGENIRVRNVEYGMNVDHEDLNEVNVSIHPGMTVHGSLGPDYTEHGTATAGVVFGHKGDYGVSGMAYGAEEFILFPEYTEENGYNRVYAVQQAIANSQTGDVIIYEMQTGGVGGGSNYVPAEYTYAIWTLTKAATDAGIIIVAAAGNGNQDLDSPAYQNYMDRGDSGAIIVGAGTPNELHNKLSFSTYGSRVNVQGWGLNVLSSGYGDYAQIGGDFNQNYTMFSGTSSATPIVTSCAIVLLSRYKELTGEYMTPLQLRDLLIDTGIPQGSGGHIGPLPDMEAALGALLDMAQHNIKEFVVFPNPATSYIQVYGDVVQSQTATLEIYNALGQRVLQQPFKNGSTIDISMLQAGIYMVQFTDNKTSITKRIIKK
jgi:subtilisin family serine protease